MDNLDPPDPSSPVFKHVLLRSARIDFASFYCAASTMDEELMDALIFAYAALTYFINAPRLHIRDAVRRQLERDTTAREQFFTELREKVRASPTFAGLEETDRTKIERLIFEVLATVD
jgi:hypothetical protein